MSASVVLSSWCGCVVIHSTGRSRPLHVNVTNSEPRVSGCSFQPVHVRHAQAGHANQRAHGSRVCRYASSRHVTNKIALSTFVFFQEKHSSYRCLEIQFWVRFAVLDVDYSPTGREFVSGSFDKTIRIFPVDQGRSRSVLFLTIVWNEAALKHTHTHTHTHTTHTHTDTHTDTYTHTTHTCTRVYTTHTHTHTHTHTLLRGVVTLRSR